MKIYELKEMLNNIEDDKQGIYYDDPNFVGRYDITRPSKSDFIIDKEGALLIKFPFESPVEF